VYRSPVNEALSKSQSDEDDASAEEENDDDGFGDDFDEFEEGQEAGADDFGEFDDGSADTDAFESPGPPPIQHPMPSIVSTTTSPVDTSIEFNDIKHSISLFLQSW